MELSKYDSDFGKRNKLLRLLWNMVRIVLFRPFCLNFFSRYRVWILRLFGAKIHKTANIYSSVKIWAPWNLTVGSHSTLGPDVDCYNQGYIVIGENTIVSQKSYLCASTHDYSRIDFPLVLSPIEIGNKVWIAADSFIGPGVKVGDGVIVGARSALFKDAEAYGLYGGNPSKLIKKRNISESL